MLTGCMLVTGSSRGIGLELIKQLVGRRVVSPKVIIATCRNPDAAGELQDLQRDHPDTVVIKRLDVTHYESLGRFVESIKPYTADHGLGCLVNNAGVSPGLTRFTTVKPEMMADTFNVNVIAPLMLTKAVAGEMKRAASGSADNFLLKKPLVVNLGSVLGSIGENSRGGVYPYRTSKAALHMLTRNLSVDLAPSGVNAICVHPGWLRTDMGGQSAPTSVEEGVAGIVENLLVGYKEEVHNGNFYDYQGNRVQW